MCTISVKVIKNPKKIRTCEGYRHAVTMLAPHIRLYGRAFVGDPPYVMYICLKCAEESDDPKIKEALAAYNKSLHRSGSTAARKMSARRAR